MSVVISPELLSAGATAGYVAGTMAENLALRIFDKNALPALQIENAGKSELERSSLPRNSLSRKLVSTLGGLCAAGAFCGLQAVGSVESPAQPSTLQVVLDRSHPISLPDSDGVPQKREEALVTSFMNTSTATKVEYITSYLGRNEYAAPKQILASATAGEVKLADAISLAGSRTLTAGSSYDFSSKKNHRTAGIVVVSNGNTIGSVKEAVAMSKAQGGTPISVVNIRANATNPRIEKDMKQLAAGTGGSYWTAKDTAYPDKIRDTIIGNIKPSATPDTYSNGLRVLYSVLSLASLGLAAAGFSRIKEFRVIGGDKRHN